MKKERFREVLDTLEALKEMLIKYCHAEECDNIHDCPASHEECAKKLGLDTAIAWELACDVKGILNWMEANIEWARKHLEWAMPKVSGFARVVEQHALSFPELDVLVQRTYTALLELQDLIKEA